MKSVAESLAHRAGPGVQRWHRRQVRWGGPWRIAAGAAAVWASLAAAATPSTDMQAVGRFEIDRTEVTIGAFRAFVQATGMRTKAEREGGSLIYEAGWEKRAGWAWHAPYGTPGADH